MHVAVGMLGRVGAAVCMQTQRKIGFGFRPRALEVEAGLLSCSRDTASICPCTSNCVRADFHRLGTEHEKLAVCVDGRERAPHTKIAHILQGLVDRHGWEAMTEDGNIIGAKVMQCP